MLTESEGSSLFRFNDLCEPEKFIYEHFLVALTTQNVQNSFSGGESLLKSL